MNKCGRASSYSTCIAAAAVGAPQRGVVHSVFDAAANIVFPGGFVLSLNAVSSAQMPNGLQLSALPATFPFSALRAGMPVLLGAQRLHIEAIGCSLDLSSCSQWNPHIERPERLDVDVVRKNGEWLAKRIALHPPHPRATARVALGCGGCKIYFPTIRDMAQYLCGRGAGLTPTGDDILAGWMAVGWLLYAPTPSFLHACQQIIKVARQQTHLLSQCWLSYAAEGNVAQPIGALLDALTRDPTLPPCGCQPLEMATQAVLAMGASSGYDVIQGILLGLQQIYPYGILNGARRC